MKPGDLCKVTVDFLEVNHNFIGIFLKIDSSRYPWYRISFLHDNVIKNLDMMLSEISKCIEVINEIG